MAKLKQFFTQKQLLLIAVTISDKDAKIMFRVSNCVIENLSVQFSPDQVKNIGG